jgi:hypothetical protein
MPQEIPNVDQLLQHATARIRTHADQASIRFVNVADQSGVNFNYFRGETGQFWIVEPNGGGVAWLDSDQDGWLDLFFVNGCPLPPGSGVADINKELEWSSRFFRNDGRGGFTDSTLQAGLVTDLYGQGVTVADFDNDGFSDLYVTGYGATALFHNRGDGTFQDVTLLSGTGVTRFSTGCVFTDLNRDGVLDLYVATYVDFDQALHGKPCRNSSTGEAEYCGPRCCPGTPDILFAGNGDGTFKDVSIATGVASEVQPGFSVAAADLNNDDWPDLYVANDGQINTLWLNTTANGSDGSIQLSSCGLALGCGVDADGIAQGSMGIACGDVDRDGFLDLGITNFYHEHFTLYRNAAGNGFEDLSTSYRLLGATRTTMGWGTHFADFDNDGWLDLFVANGHINRSRTGTPPYEMPAQLFRNSGQGSFVEIGPTAGPYFQQHVIGRGSAVGDYDNDGYEDIAVAHHHRPAALLHNNTQPDRTVLAIRLVGSSSSRDAMNARVFATIRTESTATPTELVREICPGTSFLSADDYRIRFGIDRDAQVDIRVHWPSGDRQTWHNLRPGGTVVLREMQSGIAVLP